MDKDNSQESMISSNSLSFGKNRGEAYYSSNPTFYVGIDCIIFGFNEGKISLLLLKRIFEPAMGEWSLMGGFVQNNESVDDAAKRVLHELTGLENVYMEQVGTFGAIDRDPGERVISVAYYALININEYDRKLVQKHNAYWVNMNELPPLIFDHPEMVEKARELMKQKASVEPIGFNLLPKLFTLSQLQSLYEAIYGETRRKPAARHCGRRRGGSGGGDMHPLLRCGRTAGGVSLFQPYSGHLPRGLQEHPDAHRHCRRAGKARRDPRGAARRLCQRPDNRSGYGSRPARRDLTGCAPCPL